MSQHHQQTVRENVYRKILEGHLSQKKRKRKVDQVRIPVVPNKQFQEGYVLHCLLQRIGFYWKDGF